MKLTLLALSACCGLVSSSFSAQAVLIGGVEFPDGYASFADAVVSYDPIMRGTQPVANRRIPSEALGAPDFVVNAAPFHYVSLGDGGSITLRFTDNSLTGSGSAALDLWVFEVGPAVEATFVEISKDGTTWFSVGEVFGATSGIDIDAYGFGTSDFFSFVRLTDDPDESDGNADSLGADIDAIGAISSAPPVSTPDGSATATLLAFSLSAIAFCRKFNLR